MVCTNGSYGILGCGFILGDGDDDEELADDELDEYEAFGVEYSMLLLLLFFGDKS